jgi:hypothetical protein
MTGIVDTLRVKLTHWGLNTYLLILAVAVFTLAYGVPTAIYFRPFGMDVYSHMVYTRDMYESTSLNEFYDKIRFEAQDSELGIGYPFGIWFFGAMIAKVVGVNPYDVANFLPIVLTGIICVLIYAMARLFIDPEISPWMSVAFMLSMPVVSMSLLSYRPSVFVTIFLLVILFLNQKHEIRLRKSIPLTALCVFALCISHTGTFLFLITFSLAYVLIKSSVWGMFQRRMFALITVLLVGYVLTVSAFPNIQSQYIDKSTYYSTIGEIVSEKIYISFPADMGEIFHKEVFENKNIVHAIMWSAMVFGLCKLIIHVREDMLKRVQTRTGGFQATIPILGSIKNISHSVLTTPFWIGPLQVLLTVPGYSRLNVKGKCMLCTAAIVTIIPGAFYTGSTGALRELYYMLIIMPFVASAGLAYLIERVAEPKQQKSPFWVPSATLAGLMIFAIFSATLLAPIIGAIYYLPPTSGANFEINSLKWLGTVKDTGGNAIGYGYRNMVEVYANKTNPWTRPGTETRVFLQNLLNTFFSSTGEDYSKGLYYTFRGDYLIDSDRVLRNLQGMDSTIRDGTELNYTEPGDVFLDNNTNLDKFYDSDRIFGIYRYIPPSYNIYLMKDDSPGLRFDENATQIKDAGVAFWVQTGTYDIQLDKKRPEIILLRNDQIDILGEGYMRDQISLSGLGGPLAGYNGAFFLNELEYPIIQLKDNEVVYKTILQDSDGANLATLTVGYTFYQKAIRKDITVSNDWLVSDADYALQTLLYSSHYSPSLPYFSYYGLDGKVVNKTIYPSEDTVQIGNLDFDMIYFNNGVTGLSYLFTGSNQYPNEIRYKRSTAYNYSYGSVGLRRTIEPSRAMHVTEFISLGDRKTAEDNVEAYASTVVYPYPDGIIPVVLAGYSDAGGAGAASDRDILFQKLSARNVTYNEGINPYNTNMTPLASIGGNANLIPYIDVLTGRLYDNISVQNRSIRSLGKFAIERNLSSRGLISRSLTYNLDTLSLLTSNGFTHIIGQPSADFYYDYYPQEMRDPSYARLHGNETSVMILPVTESKYDYADPIKDWKSVVDLSAKNGGLSVLVYSQENFSGGHRQDLIDFVDYAQSKGLTFMSSDELVRRVKLSQNIDVTVSRTGQQLAVSTHNRNGDTVFGFTLEAELPQENGGCPYTSDSARIDRVANTTGICRIYASVDLKPDETKRFTLGPSA